MCASRGFSERVGRGSVALSARTLFRQVCRAVVRLTLEVKSRSARQYASFSRAVTAVVSGDKTASGAGERQRGRLFGNLSRSASGDFASRKVAWRRCSQKGDGRRRGCAWGVSFVIW